MFMRAGCCSEAAKEIIDPHVGKLTGGYDLFMTSYDKNFPLSHAVFAAKCVCALT